MLLSVFGSPSALMYGGLNVVRNLTEIGLGGHRLVNANNVENLRTEFSGAQFNADARVVFYSDLPSSELCDLFIKTAAPMVLFLDNFDDVVTYVGATRELSFFESVRLASRSICALEPIIRSDLVLKMDARAYSRPLIDIIGEIGEFFNSRMTAAQIKQIAATFSTEKADTFTFSDYLYRTFPHACPPGKGIERLTADERAIAQPLAHSYAAIAAGRSFSSVDWPVGMLIDSAAPNGAFAGRIELVGPARFLAFGPYLHLTPGRWCADIVFAIDDNLSRNQLYVDAYAGEILAVVTAPLPDQGRFSLQISFTIADPLEPVQLRFQCLSGAIEGSITLDRISLRLTEA